MTEPGTEPGLATADRELDARGLLCPEPVMLLHREINAMAPGSTLRVLATDPSTRRDFQRFCQFLGHALLVEHEEQDCLRYLIRKGG